MGPPGEGGRPQGPPSLLWCSPCRSGGKMHSSPTCWIETGGAGTSATRTLTCIRSHHFSLSCPRPQRQSLQQVTATWARRSLRRLRAVTTSAALHLWAVAALLTLSWELSRNGSGTDGPGWSSGAPDSSASCNTNLLCDAGQALHCSCSLAPYQMIGERACARASGGGAQGERILMPTPC